MSLPIAYQQIELHRLRSSSAAPPPARITEPSDRLAVSPVSQDEGAELARLRERRDALREQLADGARRLAAKPVATIAVQDGPVLLEMGRAVPVTNLVVAGHATPEAAAQTLFARVRGDAVEDLVDSSLMSPTDRARYDELRDQPGGRSVLSESLQASLTHVAAIELVAIEPIDERRRQVVLRQLSPTRTNEQRLTFGHAGNGWKWIP